jgi:hypothetical protein
VNADGWTWLTGWSSHRPRRGEDEREEEGMLQGVLKAYRRKERLVAFAYAAPRVALVVGGVAAIVGAVIAVVALVK